LVDVPDVALEVKNFPQESQKSCNSLSVVQASGVHSYRLGFLVCVSLLILVLSALAIPIAGTRTIPGHVPQVVPSLTPMSRIPAERVMRLAVGLPVRDPVGLRQFVADVSNPASPQYQQYVTSDQFTERFGPTQDDFQAVINFLTTNDFTVVYTHSNRMLVEVTGTVASIEQLFQVRMQTYQHPTEARTFFAPDSEPAIDAAIPILFISGLNDYVLPRPASLIVQPDDATANPLPQGGTGPGGRYRGSDFRTAYAPGIPASWNGAGQFVGLLEFDGYFPNDITTYESSRWRWISKWLSRWPQGFPALWFTKGSLAIASSAAWRLTTLRSN
jgi:hypothetical protein